MSDLNHEEVTRHPCVSDLALDRLLSDEPSDDAHAPIHAHLAACEACRTRRAAMSAQHAAFLERVPTFDALAAGVRDARDRASSDTRTLGRRTLAVAALAAVATLVFVQRPGQQPTDHVGPATEQGLPVASTDTRDTRTKGGPSVAFFLRRGETVTEAGPDTVLRPGDHIRFVYSTARPQHLAILNRDAQGVSVYYPSGAHAVAVAPGNAVPLDFSVELDAYVGRERVFALFCDAPIALGPVKQTLEDTGDLAAPAGCVVRTIDLQKAPAQ